MNIDFHRKNEVKLLYVLNVAQRVNNFSHSAMLAAKELGFEFHIAGNWSYPADLEREADEKEYGIKIHQIDFIRTPYHPGNWKAYVQLKELVQREKYDVIHCNTPIGGVLGRIVGRQCKVPKIIYQAHGFHFYKGAPLCNWLLYYPIERIFAHQTNAIITINSEDFERAQKFSLKANGKVYYVPGVGIELDDFQNRSEKYGKEIYSDLNVFKNDFVLISVGELNKNKNNETIIKSLALLNRKDIHYILCGNGEEKENLEYLVKKLDLSQQVHFLGYRADVINLLKASDIFLLPSKREGLSRALMEAMACGLPCIVSKIRGNKDLVVNEENGYLCDPMDKGAFANAIQNLVKDDKNRNVMSEKNREKIHMFSTALVKDEMKRIYRDVCFCGYKETREWY